MRALVCSPGGAIFSRNGSVTLLNDTISGNTAAQGGRGVYVLGDARIRHAAATLNNTLIGQADTTVSDFVATTPSTAAAQRPVASATSSGQRATSAAPSFRLQPQISALANNGGPTQTMALNSGSPAIDTGNDAAASSLATDQQRMVPAL